MSTLRTDLDAKVRDIIHRFHCTKTLHSIVSEMYDAPEFERLFWETMNHDLDVIRHRSQNLADGEITVMQKAFVTLMGEVECGLAAIELYVNEIIGLEFVSDNNKAQTLANALQTRDYILNHSRGSKQSPSPKNTHQEEDIQQIPGTQSPAPTKVSSDRKLDKQENIFVSGQSETSTFSTPSHNITRRKRKRAIPSPSEGAIEKPSIVETGDTMFKKLFATYQNAKKEFDASLDDPRALRRSKPARFLRDTTENCLAYLAARGTPSGNSEANVANQDIPGGKATVDEMKLTLQAAIEAAEQGSGGKKRRFDEDWSNTPEAPASMRPPAADEPRVRRDPVPRGTYSTSELPPRRIPVPRRSEMQESPSVGRRTTPTPRRPEMQRSPSVGRRMTPVAHRPEIQRSPSVGRRVRGFAKIERTPHTLYPASAGKDKSRVFPKPTQGLYKPVVRSPMFPPPRADCYRPAYDRRPSNLPER